MLAKPIEPAVSAPEFSRMQAEKPKAVPLFNKWVANVTANVNPFTPPGKIQL